MNQTSEGATPVCKSKPTLENTSNEYSVEETAKFQVLPTPVKSENDKKEYKVIRLANGLTACLISDTSSISEGEEIEKKQPNSEESESSLARKDESKGTDDDNVSLKEKTEDENNPKSSKSVPEQKMAAAGLCVGVGSFSNPKEVPGMAHFLEHLIFMGSEKYPKENAFDEFIKQNGGRTNASTMFETTVFYFECLEFFFEKSLDIFSQFFITPLLKRDAMIREREAIESEFQIAVTSDRYRKEQLIRGLTKQDCPVNNFPWGNLKTLRDNVNDEDLYKRVHEFRKRHYSAHRMTLAIQASLPLEKLEKYVLKSFSGVLNNGLPADDFSQFHENVFDTPQFNKIYYVKPVNDGYHVHLTWALPSLEDKYRSKPHHFVSYLLDYEGKGSLLSYLRKKLWVIEKTVGNREPRMGHNSLYKFFTINLNLTEEGYNHLSDVIEAIFSYLRMLKESGSQQRVFDELQSVSNTAFKYLREESAKEIVGGLCEAMQFYPPEDYITGSKLYYEYDPVTINMLIDKMTPKKANIILLHKQEIEFDMTEKWFGTQYTVKDIPETWMTQWNNAIPIPELFVPPPNSFITEDFTILPDIDSNPVYPEKILDNSLVEIWYRRDLKFKLPKASYYFYLISPLSVCDVKHLCMFTTLVNLLAINISEEIYPANKAGLAHGFVISEKGLIVKVGGFNEKLNVLLNLIAKYLVNLNDDINEEMFQAIKDQLLKYFHNELLKPARLARNIQLNLIADKNWHPLDYYSAMMDVNFKDMKKYTKDFFKSLYVKALAQGNISHETALNTVNEFIQKLKYTELKKEDQPQYHVFRVNKGQQCCRIKSFNKNDSNSIIINYYQSDHFTIQNSVIIDLIMMVIKEPLFDTLRTKEQLGYYVSCSVRNDFGVLGYIITVNAQATKTTTQYVDQRIEAFLKHTQKLLADLDVDKFQKVKSNLIKKKQSTDVHLQQEVERSWSEIISGDYIFDRIKQEIDAIEQTDLETVRSWWDAHNLFGNKENFRKLSIQVVGFKDIATEDNTQPPKGEKLEIAFLSDSEDVKNEKRDKNYFVKSIKEYKENADIFNTK